MPALQLSTDCIKPQRQEEILSFKCCQTISIVSNVNSLDILHDVRFTVADLPILSGKGERTDSTLAIFPHTSSLYSPTDGSLEHLKKKELPLSINRFPIREKSVAREKCDPPYERRTHHDSPSVCNNRRRRFRSARTRESNFQICSTKDAFRRMKACRVIWKMLESDFYVKIGLDARRLTTFLPRKLFTL